MTSSESNDDSPNWLPFTRAYGSYHSLALDRAAGKPFVSDWSSDHPHTERYLGPLANTPVADLGSLTQYAFPQENRDLLGAIRRFHEALGEPHMKHNRVVITPGATSALSLAVAWASQLGSQMLGYIPPVHYTVGQLLRLHRLEPVQVSPGQVFETDFSVSDIHPSVRAVLISDPAWYCGRRLSLDHFKTLAQWQLRTGGYVIVDGTFQYIAWDDPFERSSLLDPARTLRIVCPTKSLSMNGFRFAYLLTSGDDLPAILTLQDCMSGSASKLDSLFGLQAMQVLNTEASNSDLIESATAGYGAWLASGRVEEHIRPECGYFMFARLSDGANAFASMGPEHFHLRDREGWVRVNLLNHPDSTATVQ